MSLLKYYSILKKTHGLTDEIMEQIGDDCFCLIIPDASSNDLEQCKELHKNITILILDHHNCSNPNITNYAVVVNNQMSDKVENKALSGTGVTWKFITAYCLKYEPETKWYQQLIDMVAIANIADVMDMTQHENRAINNWGLSNITNPFLKELCDKYIKGDITPDSITWNISPKINAVCRSNNQEAKGLMFNAFVGNEMDYKKVIKILNSCHSKQKEVVKEIYEEIISKYPLKSDDTIRFNSCESTPYTGLVANKLVNYYGKPVFLFHKHNDEYRGSCRSPFDIRSTIKNSGLITICEGHDGAFGIGFKQENEHLLREYCNNLKVNTGVNVVHSFMANNIPYDIFGYFNQWDYLWGTGVKSPKFHIKGIVINNKDIRQLGTRSTIKFTYCGIDYIKFFCNQSDIRNFHIDSNKCDLMLEVIGDLEVNEYRGYKNKQVKIDKFEATMIERGGVW